MLQTSPEIDVIIEAATQYAANKNHEYVTLEHLAHGIVSFKPFNDLLIAFGCDTIGLLADIDDYLSKQTFMTSSHEDHIPKKTHSLERIFNRAFTQVLFSGREMMEPIDLFLSLSQEPNSHAAYFLLKWGIKRKELIDFYNECPKILRRKKVVSE